MIWPFSEKWRLKRKKEKAHKAAEREREEACKAAEQEHETLQELLKTHSHSDSAVIKQHLAYLEAFRKCTEATKALTELQGAELNELVKKQHEVFKKQMDDLNKQMHDLKKRKS